MSNPDLSPPLSPAIDQPDILIVDDVPDNIRLLSNILEQHGYQTRKATRGTTALTAVRAKLPSLILLDVMMPDLSGYEVCRQLKLDAATAQVPVIFLSAADDVARKVQAFQAGGADYITKPFHIDEVLARVQHQLTIIAANQTIQHLNAQLEERVKDRTQQLEIANAQLSQLAFSDPLTGLPNRTFLMSQLRILLDPEDANSGAHHALFYLDCDRFKLVNDSLGHAAGDELLLAIVQRLRSVLRQNDLLARIGGDEFVIVLPHLTGSELAIQIAERILSQFALPFRLKERDVYISFSVGIVIDCATYSDPDLLLRDADIAMYQAKTSGKDQYQVFAQSMYEQVYRRLQLETDLRQAIQRQNFSLHYQPIVDMAKNQVIGVEALLRWQHPTQGLIPPDQFIPIAEETGLISKLGNWVLQEACRQLRDWQCQQIVDPQFSISVNVSAYQFAQPDFVHQIDEILAETQLAPECLKLEITETVIMENMASAANIICNLKERCIQLSIDDFGTGYSSLSYLYSFPVDTLKIDRSFVQHLQEGSSSVGLVKAIAQIAQTMGMNVIAEGIETEEQLDQLKLLNCQFGQGYLFSKPLSAQRMLEFLAGHPSAILPQEHQ